jgi:hypothetical protein
MCAEGLIESFTIDILGVAAADDGVRQQMMPYGSRKISVYSIRPDFRSGITGRTDVTIVVGLRSFH